MGNKVMYSLPFWQWEDTLTCEYGCVTLLPFDIRSKKAKNMDKNDNALHIPSTFLSKTHFSWLDKSMLMLGLDLSSVGRRPSVKY